MGGGTMRNSRGEIDILVLCKAISLKTLYEYLYHQEKISWWRTSLTLCFFNITLSVNDKIYKILSLYLQGEGDTMRNSRGEIDNLVQCQLFVLNLLL